MERIKIIEAAKRLGVTPKTVQNSLRDGRLNGDMAGRSWRVYVDETFNNYEPRPAHRPKK